jgi:hypothetical protein
MLKKVTITYHTALMRYVQRSLGQLTCQYGILFIPQVIL